jgi:hypothetical protein
MGLSRDTFYRYQAAVEAGGVDALVEKSRRKPNQKNRAHEATEAAVVAFALDYPAHGQARVSNELRKAGGFHLAQWRALRVAPPRARIVQAATGNVGT